MAISRICPWDAPHGFLGQEANRIWVPVASEVLVWLMIRAYSFTGPMALNDTVEETGSLFVQDSFCQADAAVPRPREVTAVEPRLNSPPGGLTRRDQARETDELVGWKVDVRQQRRDEH